MLTTFETLSRVLQELRCALVNCLSPKWGSSELGDLVMVLLQSFSGSASCVMTSQEWALMPSTLPSTSIALSLSSLQQNAANNFVNESFCQFQANI